MGLVVFQLKHSLFLFLLCCYSTQIASISVDICELSRTNKYLQEDSHGYIFSPNYPNNYSHDKSCEINLIAPQGFYIRTHFLDFNIERCNNGCNCDNLIIVGEELTTPSPSLRRHYCGYTLPHDSISVQNTIKLIFYSDTTISKTGFKMEFIVVKSETPCGTRISVNSDSHYTEKKSSISSPSFPEPYPSYLHCMYHIEANYDARIRILFEDFQLESTSESCQHYVKIWNSSELDEDSIVGQYCADKRPTPFQSTGQAVTISFFANNNTNGVGFKFSYEIVTDVSWFNKPMTDCGHSTLDPIGGSLIKEPIMSDFSVAGGRIYYDCVWTLSAPAGHRVLLYNKLFPHTVSDEFNSVEIRNGRTSVSPLLQTENDHWSTATLTTSNCVYIRLTAWFHSSDAFLIVYASFIRAEDGKCADNFFLCAGEMRCIHSSLICDGIDHCKNGPSGNTSDDERSELCSFSTTVLNDNGSTAVIIQNTASHNVSSNGTEVNSSVFSPDIAYTVSAMSVLTMVILLLIISIKIWMNKRKQARAASASNDIGSEDVLDTNTVTVTTRTTPFIYINPSFDPENLGIVPPPPYDQVMQSIASHNGLESGTENRRHSSDPPPYYPGHETPIMNPIYNARNTVWNNGYLASHGFEGTNNSIDYGYYGGSLQVSTSLPPHRTMYNSDNYMCQDDDSHYENDISTENNNDTATSEDSQDDGNIYLGDGEEELHDKDNDDILDCSLLVVSYDRNDDNEEANSSTSDRNSEQSLYLDPECSVEV